MLTGNPENDDWLENTFYQTYQHAYQQSLDADSPEKKKSAKDNLIFAASLGIAKHYQASHEYFDTLKKLEKTPLYDFASENRKTSGTS